MTIDVKGFTSSVSKIKNIALYLRFYSHIILVAKHSFTVRRTHKYKSVLDLFIEGFQEI